MYYNPIVIPLFQVIKYIKPIETLYITSYQEEYGEKASTSHATYNSLIVNMQIHKKRNFDKILRMF